MIPRACIGVPLLLVLVVHFALAQNPGAMKTLVLMLSTGTSLPDPAHAGPATAAHPEVLRFEKVQISKYFWSEGSAIADINRDGHTDIVAGPFWYEGPEFKVRHEILPATETFKRQRADGAEETVEGFEGALGTHNAYSNAFVEFVYDFNHDGWPDVLVIGFPGISLQRALPSLSARWACGWVTSLLIPETSVGPGRFMRFRHPCRRWNS